MKSPENKKKWIIDQEAATVVKIIFKMCLDGKGNETIARELQENEVLIPMSYWRSKGLNRAERKHKPIRTNGVRQLFKKFFLNKSIAEILSISKHTPSHLKTKDVLKTQKKIGLYSRMLMIR